MDDTTALLSAVDAEPANPLPRLVWADHLDDAGHPVPAEFVRVCCRLAECPHLPRLRTLALGYAGYTPFLNGTDDFCHT